MTRTRRARRLPGHFQSSDPARDTSRFRLPMLAPEDRDAARQARALVTGDGRTEPAEPAGDRTTDQTRDDRAESIEEN